MEGEEKICSNVIGCCPLSHASSTVLASRTIFSSASYSSLRSFVRSCLLPRISRRNDVPLPYVTVDAPRDGWAPGPPPQVCDNAKYMSPFLYLAAMHHRSFLSFVPLSVPRYLSARLSPFDPPSPPPRDKKFFSPIRF